MLKITATGLSHVQAVKKDFRILLRLLPYLQR